MTLSAHLKYSITPHNSDAEHAKRWNKISTRKRLERPRCPRRIQKPTERGSVSRANGPTTMQRQKWARPPFRQAKFQQSARTRWYRSTVAPRGSFNLFPGEIRIGAKVNICPRTCDVRVCVVFLFCRSPHNSRLYLFMATVQLRHANFSIPRCIRVESKKRTESLLWRGRVC